MRRGQTRAAPGHTAAAMVRTVVMLETDKLRILHITTHNYTRGEIRSIIVWCGDQTVSSVTRVNTTPPPHTEHQRGQLSIKIKYTLLEKNIRSIVSYEARKVNICRYFSLEMLDVNVFWDGSPINNRRLTWSHNSCSS